ncbi:MAG: hypothetical protein D6790_14060, partial [Caldilineae bacterium]
MPFSLDWLRSRAAVTPDKLAVLFEGQAVTYRMLDQLADRLAAGLIADGVATGDRVAVRASTSVAYVALIHAVARLGGVLVPLN